MKCPKCAYLGFETGDRCKNCGYDFSLLSAAESDPSDLIHQASSDDFDYVHQPSSKEPDYVFRTPSDDDVSSQLDGGLDPYDRWFDNRHEPLGGRQGTPFVGEPAASPSVVHLMSAAQHLRRWDLSNHSMLLSRNVLQSAGRLPVLPARRTVHSCE